MPRIQKENRSWEAMRLGRCEDMRLEGEKQGGF